MTQEQVRTKHARINARYAKIAKAQQRWERACKQLELACDHPKLQYGRDITGHSEYWCDDCGMVGEGTYIP